MNIEVGHTKYYLQKRYTEFLMLHNKLLELQLPEIEDFDFPPKVWFNTFSEQLIEFRRTRFEGYLGLLLTLAGKYPLLKKELDQFLGVPEKVDLPKKYPKTPKPLAGAKGKIDKPLGLEDSTGEGVLQPAPGKRVEPAGLHVKRPSLTKTAPTAVGNTAGTGNEKASAAHLFVTLISLYLLAVGVFAVFVAISPANARPAAGAMLVCTGAAVAYAYKLVAITAPHEKAT
jgi:hypothetical protein